MLTIAKLACCLAALSTATALSAPPERTLPVDPVELVAGREVPGKPELAVVHEGIEYRFATEQSKEAFEKDRSRYEVFDGGACGAMGALTGMGDARRYAVHGGRIFFFASDGCRATFLKDPAPYIETDDEKVFGSNEQVAAGRAALDRLVTWAGGKGGEGGKGGAERIRGLSTFRASAAKKVEQGGKTNSVTNETVISFPDRYFQKQTWNESWFSTTSGPDGAAMASTKGAERIAAARERAFKRSMARWPIVILKAYLDNAPKADCPGLIVIGDGEGTLDGTPVEHVKVWLNGAASRLTIDKATGRPVQLAFRGRDHTSRVGESVRTFTTFATVEGVTLPTAYTVSFNGKDLHSAASKHDAFEVNPKVEPALFKLPE